MSSVGGFLNTITDRARRDDCLAVTRLMEAQTGFHPKMWGSGIVGFGSRHYKYESGREGDMPVVAFAPRKDAIVFYLSANIPNRDQLLEKLGRHKEGKGCVSIKKLEDVNLDVLKKLVTLTAKQRID